MLLEGKQLLSGVWIIVFYITRILSADDTITPPDGQDNCSCEWSQWMNEDDPAYNHGVDIETYTRLRSRGQKFCEKPVDIQCYNIGLQRLTTVEDFGVMCSVDTGFTCNLLCDDYKIRVACCYCPPKAIGPTFQIEAEATGHCLTVMDTPSLTSSPSLALVSSCNSADDSQLWSWVSYRMLKNERTQKCIQTNETAKGSLVVTADCDDSIATQHWSYDKLTSSLSDSIRYLDSETGMITDSSSSSHWKAVVDAGTTDLTSMQGWPCKNSPVAPDHGSVSCTLESYQGSACYFSCDYGYRLPQNSHFPAVCMRNQMFNATTTTCERIVCMPAMETPDNGAVSCSNSNNQDSSCVFMCNAGYAMEGEMQSICLESGVWETPAPVCKRSPCTPDAAGEGIRNGAVNCSDGNFYQSVCKYTCNKGYELEGANARACLQSTQWNTSLPVCQKIQCPALEPLFHGSTTCGDGNNYGSVCRYSCEPGYILDGSGSTTCNHDRTWSTQPPTCSRITCSQLTRPGYGSVICSDNSFFNSRCTYNCNPGYQVKGEKVLTCTADGWDFGSPECTRIECSPTLRSPLKGNVRCTEGSFYNSQCSFTCNNGYRINGSDTVVCGSSGWNDTAPTCGIVTCPSIRKPRNGKVSCVEGNQYKSYCFFSCREGYVKRNPDDDVVTPAICRADGTWSREPYDCKRIKCREFKNLRKVQVSCTDGNNYNSNCSFTCQEGFNLYGATETTCGTSGWDAQAPSCDRLVCPSLVQPANGFIKCTKKGKLSCTYSCNNGFQLVGRNKTSCQSDETWTYSETPSCQRIRCSKSLKAPAHGTVKCSNEDKYESKCSYTCDQGYLLEGEKLLVCNEMGAWDKTEPNCSRISCSPLDNFGNGQVMCSDGAFYTSRCTFSCGVGYNLIGAKSVQCLLSGKWSTVLPYCERITCSPDFSNPSNGKVSCTDFSNYGSVCQFHCQEGFSLQGASRTQCNNDGWSNTRAPSCKKITCPDEGKIIEHGTQSCDLENEFQSSCDFTCDETYEIVGVQSRSCGTNGQWTSKKPTCKKIECPNLPNLRHGEIVCQHMNYSTKSIPYVDETCAFICNTGYERTGPGSRVCTTNKSWIPAGVPVCNLIVTAKPTTTTTVTTTKTTTTTTKPTTTTPTTTPVATTTSKPTTVKAPTNNVAPNTTTVRTTKTTKPPVPRSPTDPSTSMSTETDGQDPTSDPAAAGFPIIPVVVSVVGIVVLALIVVVCICLRKRSKKPTTYRKNFSPIHDNRYDESELKKLVPNGSTRSKYAALPLDRLESEFNRRHADDDKLFREEFSSLPDGHGTREAGGKIQNKDKNRYTNILPYDHSRVVLPKSGPNDSDYINASFVDGYKHKGKFIAAQGPKEGTINDFWRMVWDQNVTTIIMVTNLEEGKEIKCAQYWPTTGKSVYGDLSVVFQGENRLVDYTIRKFTIQQMRGDATLSMQRNLMHYHFTSWPDFGVPKSPSGMLKFMRKIKHSSPTGYGAIVVHCSAGVGRTGTFICIDAMVDMMLRESKIDVYGFVSQMRGQRPEMVQTEQQYIFIYNALLEHHLYGDTEIEATEVNAHIDELNQRLPGNVTGMEHEFRKLTTIRIQKEQMRAGNHPANMRKNRVVLILPYDWNRVILPIRNGLENSDYINASYIDGYRQKDAYIATQGPLPHTVEDFWRMVWESKSGSIVMLTELVERGQAKCEQYWPADNATVYGDLTVDNVSVNENEHYTTRDFVITSANQTDRKQSVKQFHYHGWPETGPPVSGYSMIDLVEQVQKQQQTSGNHPIIIHCSAGAGRTGAFCALSTALEQVKAEGILDMFQIVKCLRMQRPHMVQNLEQYEFCYRAVQEYIDSMSEYYNFK